MRQSQIAPISVVALDYEKVKSFLMECTDETQICVTLEALWWRVTKTVGKAGKGEVLHTYSHFDILGTESSSPDIIFHLMNFSKWVL